MLLNSLVVQNFAYSRSRLKTAQIEFGTQLQLFDEIFNASTETSFKMETDNGAKTQSANECSYNKYSHQRQLLRHKVH